MSGKLLEGKVVVVTGAGGGIGRAVAIGAAMSGAHVVVNDVGASLDGAVANPALAQQVVEEIEAAGGSAIANTSSVSDATAAQDIVQSAVDAFGRIDAVINNAGILRDTYFHKMEPEEWDAVIKVHLYGAFNVSRAAARYFREQGSGAFVHMTSTSGLIGNLAQSNYSAAKLGIVALSKSIALDMKRFGVRSNCVAPFAWSRMISSIKADTDDQKERVARLRKMTPDKIAPLCVYLVSDRAEGVNGQIFSVRNNEIFLFSQPRPVRSVHTMEGWTPESIADTAIPALQDSFYSLDVSSDVFPWDPV